MSWKSRKQKTVALSSISLYALEEAAKEAIHLRQLLMDIVVPESGSIELFNDNRGAQRLAKNPSFHGRAKHIIPCVFLGWHFD